MIDREKVLAVLRHRFPGADAFQLAAAANAIVGLDDEWEVVEVESADLLTLSEYVQPGDEIRLLRRRQSDPRPAPVRARRT